MLTDEWTVERSSEVYGIGLAMVQNTLKRRARAFAATHSVPYLTALHAVDEPLHELRDLFRLPENSERGFHIVSREGSYGPAYSALESQNRVEELEQISLRGYILESSRRLWFIAESGAGDIWGYRELYRAGLLPEGHPAMEPIFHHYEVGIGTDLGSMFKLGRELGFYPVNFSGFAEIRDKVNLRPVTEAQLAALKGGAPAGPIEKRLFISKKEDGEPKDVTERFGTLATHTGDGSKYHPRITLLIKGDKDAMLEEIRARDLDPRLFTITGDPSLR